MIYLQVELKKLKRRHTAAAFLLTLAFLAAYTFWCLTDVNPGRLNDVTAMVEGSITDFFAEHLAGAAETEAAA